jgi:MFS family permease
MIEEIAPGTETRADPPFDAPRTRAGFWLVAAVYTLVMLGSTLPVPLYVLWAPEMGFGPFTTTLVFAVYALGTVVALVLFSPMSDRAGRRPLLAAGLLVTVVSTALFLAASDVGTLLAARFLSGLGTGVYTATATATLNELGGPHKARRTSMVSTASNMGGLGLGAIAAGLLAQYGTDPTHLVFWVFLGTLVPALIAVAIVPETVADRHMPTVDARRPTVPDQGEARSEFLRAAAVVLAAFAVCGLFSSLVPAFLREELHVHNFAGLGAEVALLFFTAAAAQLTAPQRWLDSRRPTPTLLVAGVVVFEAGLWSESVTVFIAGTVVAGIGVGLAFRRGIGVTQRLADPQRRANLLASYFLAAYSGTIVPTLALGLLDQALNEKVATLLLAVAVVLTTVAAARTAPRHRAAHAIR